LLAVDIQKNLLLCGRATSVQPKGRPTRTSKPPQYIAVVGNPPQTRVSNINAQMIYSIGDINTVAFTAHAALPKP
jgi:hypothetical protein